MGDRPPAMRRAGLLLVLFVGVAHADDKPKGHIVDPWARMPHPRDGMKLPDPRKAAEKATSDGVVAPVTPTPSNDATPEPPPAPTPPIVVVPAATVPLSPSTQASFGTARLSSVEPPPAAPHDGLTVEVNAGFGAIYVVDRNHVVTSPGGVGGVDLGVGGWLSHDAALTLRIAGSSTSVSERVVSAAFVGPSLQIWGTEHTWFGFGFGLATLAIDSPSDEDDFSLGGPGVDLRLGHTFYENGKHTFNGSIEVTPSFVKHDFDDGGRVAATVASFGLLLGWQYL
jgi:hypothetical protein